MFTKAFRLFVSSTFADFVAERDVLQREVFPALDAYCAARGYQFYSVDLRWGVNEEAQLDQRAVQICLGEVEAAKNYPPPNLLIMIGNRYGWIPLPYAIARDEFGAVDGWLEDRNRPDAVRALRTLYQHDDNYLVPGAPMTKSGAGPLTSAYTLRSRVDEVPELRAHDRWVEAENELRGALQQAADDLLKRGQIDAAAHEKYFLSLTEQEIIRGLSHRSGSNEYSLQSPSDGADAIAFIREIVNVPGSGTGAGHAYIQREPRVDGLKDRIKRSLADDRIITSHITLDARASLSGTYLANFAAQIEGALKTAIDKHQVRFQKIERLPNYALESERYAHRTFAREHLKIFVGRERDLTAIAHYLSCESDRPLILHGRSGLGKSALMARAIAIAQESGSLPAIARFIGASAASSNLRSLLVSLIEDLAARGLVTKPNEIQQEVDKFNDQVRELLSSIAEPVIIVVDALDQLQKPYDLDWLPSKLPNALKLLLSVLDDPAYESDSGIFKSLQARFPPHAFLEIMPLRSSEGREILSALEQQTRHRLRESQRDYVITQFEKAGASPLYLRTVFEIARSWKAAAVAGTGRQVLAESTSGVIVQFIKELSSVQHHEPELVTHTLGYLVASKNGLSAKEMMEILSRDEGVMSAMSSEQHSGRADKLPPAVWIRLSRDLAPFLMERQIDDQPLLQFFHREMREVAYEQCYARIAPELHEALGTYFDSQALDRHGKFTYAKRSLSELPFQLHLANGASRLGEILLSPEWMQQKLAAFGPRPLIDDYQYARTKPQKLTGQTLELVDGVLARDVSQLVPQIIGRLRVDLAHDPDELIAIDGLLLNARALVAPPALVPRWPRFTAPGGPQMRRLEGHSSRVTAVAFSPDGRYIVSGSGDKTLRLWEVATGRSRCLEGHTLAVTAVAYSPDGRHIVSGSHDGTLRLWDVASGEVQFIEGDAVTAVAFSPDGQHIVSGANDGTLALWEVASRDLNCMFKGHSEDVTSVAFSPDGQCMVSGSYDRTLRLWELETGRSRCVKFSDKVRAVAYSPDGQHVAVGADYKSLWLCDVASGQTRLLEGAYHATNGFVETVAFSPDGRHIVSGFADIRHRGGDVLWLWEVASGRSRPLEGYTSFVNAVAFSPDGRHIASGSDDATVRLWQVASEQHRPLDSGLPTFRAWGPWRSEEHTEEVTAVAFSPDGQHIVSGSGDWTIRHWDVASGGCRRFESYIGYVIAVAYSSDGQCIVSCTNNNMAQVWDAETLAELGTLEGPKNSVFTSVAISPDGGHIVIGSDDNTVRVWDAKTLAELTILDGHTNKVTAIAYSPDGRHIVSGSYDNTVRVWDARTFAELTSIDGHAPVAYSPDGRNVAFCKNDNWLCLWEVASGQSRLFKGHTSWVHAIAFSPDGRHILSGSDDSTLRLWETATGQELARFDGDSSFWCLAVAPNGKSVAAGDGLGRVHLLEVFI